MCVSAGGIAWRRPSIVALPAAVAAAVMARPKIAALAADMEKAGLLLQGQLMKRYDERIEKCISSLKALLDYREADQVDNIIRLSFLHADREWARVLGGMPEVTEPEEIGKGVRGSL